MTHITASDVLGAGAFGLLSASALVFGSLLGVWRLPRQKIVGYFMSFGAGSLLEALSIELFGTILQKSRQHKNKGLVLAAVGTAVLGGVLFSILNHILNSKGGFVRKFSTIRDHVWGLRLSFGTNLIQRIGLIPNLRHLEIEEFQEIVKGCDKTKYMVGEEIFDSDYNSFHIILTGEIELKNDYGDVIILKTTDIFGQRTGMTGWPQRLSAVCLSNSAKILSFKTKEEDHVTTILSECFPELSKTSLDRLFFFFRPVAVRQNSKIFDARSEDTPKHGLFLILDGAVVSQIYCRTRCGFSCRVLWETTYHPKEVFYDRGEENSRTRLVSTQDTYMFHLPAEGIAQLPVSLLNQLVISPKRRKPGHQRLSLIRIGFPPFPGSENEIISKRLVETFDERELLDLNTSYLSSNKNFDVSTSSQSSSVDSVIWNEDAPHSIGSKQAALAIWLGILLDGVPESFIIGILYTSNTGLWSFVIGVFLSNFPESLSSSGIMKQHGMKKRIIITLWCSICVVTVIGSMIGATVFFNRRPNHEVAIAAIEGLAGGAMLTMIATTALPEAFEHGGVVIGICTLSGFLTTLCVSLLSQ